MRSFHFILFLVATVAVSSAASQQGEVATGKTLVDNGVSNLRKLLKGGRSSSSSGGGSSSGGSSNGGSSSGGSSSGGSSSGGSSGGSSSSGGGLSSSGGSGDGGGDSSSSSGEGSSSRLRPLSSSFGSPAAVMVVSLGAALLAIGGLCCCGCFGARGLCITCADFLWYGSTRDNADSYQLETDGVPA